MKIRNILGNRYRGQIGKDTIASSWKGREYVKAYAVPENPRTERQQANRNRFGGAKEGWRALSPEERAAYDRRAAPEQISGWNLFVREHMEGTPGVAGAPSSNRQTPPPGGDAPPARDPASEPWPAVPPPGTQRRIRDILGKP